MQCHCGEKVKVGGSGTTHYYINMDGTVHICKQKSKEGENVDSN